MDEVTETVANVEPPIEFFLTEYEMAQDSAQHHDNLVWSVSTLMWGVSAVLLGFVLSSLKDKENPLIICMFCILGVTIIFCAWYFTRQFRSIRGQKYKRCKELEAIFSFKQHTDLKHPESSQTNIYSAVMLLFLATWVAVLVKVFSILWIQYH